MAVAAAAVTCQMDRNTKQSFNGEIYRNDFDWNRWKSVLNERSACCNLIVHKSNVLEKSMSCLNRAESVERAGNTHSPTNNTKPANVHLYVSERRRHCCLAVWFCLSSLGFLTRNVINLQLKAVYWLVLPSFYILHYMTSRIERWRRWRRWRHCHRFYFTFLELFSQTSDGSWIAIDCGYIRAFCLQFIPVVLYMILSFVVRFGVIGYQNNALFLAYIHYSGDS